MKCCGGGSWRKFRDFGPCFHQFQGEVVKWLPMLSDSEKGSEVSTLTMEVIPKKGPLEGAQCLKKPAECLTSYIIVATGQLVLNPNNPW